MGPALPNTGGTITLVLAATKSPLENAIAPGVMRLSHCSVRALKSTACISIRRERVIRREAVVTEGVVLGVVDGVGEVVAAPVGVPVELGVVDGVGTGVTVWDAVDPNDSDEEEEPVIDAEDVTVAEEEDVLEVEAVGDPVGVDEGDGRIGAVSTAKKPLFAGACARRV